MNSNLQPTVPIIRQVTQKHVPLVVRYINTSDSKETIVQLKLDDDQKIQEFLKNNLHNFESIKDKNSTLFGLRLKSTNQYINEKNRKELLSINEQQRFHEVELCFNLEIEVKNYIEKISSLKLLNNADILSNRLISLKKHIESDQIFATEFFARGGKKIIIDYIKECDRTSDSKKWNILLHLYNILIILIKILNLKSLISWDLSEIDLPVIQLVCDTVNEASRDNMRNIIPDDLVLLFLQIIDDALNNSQHTRELMLRDLKFSEITYIIQRQNTQIKTYLLTLIINAFNQGDENFQKNLHSILTQQSHIELFRHEIRLLVINENLVNSVHLKPNEKSSGLNFHKINFLRKKNEMVSVENENKINEACMDSKVNEEILKNFSIIQKKLLDIEFERKFSIPVDKNFSNRLIQISKNAFETSTNSKSINDEEKFSRLGFINPSIPIEDFKNIPHGLIAFEFMEYFAFKQIFRPFLYSFVIEKTPKNSEYTFPFAKASIGMVKLLINMLRIGNSEQPDDQFHILFIIFTLNIDGIYEFFAKCLVLFAKIWTEMKAQSLDFDRSLAALRDSLYKIISDANKSKHSLDRTDYKSRIEDFNAYMEMWKYDNLKTLIKNDKYNLEPIKQVKRILTDEVISMIKPKRMFTLCKEETFFKVQAKDKKPTKQKQTWRLSSDLKTLIYTEYDSSEKETYRGQIEVDSIKDVKKEEIKCRQPSQFFSLCITCKRFDVESNEQSFIFGSQNEDLIDFWLDAINLLINSKPTANMTCFVECLVDTQLLDLHTLGFDIPQEIPNVPSLPSDFEFQYKI